ncbi:MAG: prephenate dehydrogenase [Candidatus Omnitrophota bacterium]|jgi:prephenate dehydrogenase
MMQFKKVTIIGVGLIGGSIGLAIKKRVPAVEVTGVFRRPSTLRKALKYKAIDKGTMSLAEGVRDADLIVLAAPVHTIVATAREAIKHAKKGVVITDAGSTKAWIVGKIEKVLSGNSSIRFVGSHPMAGSEHAGVEFARKDLLDGAPCIVTKTANTNKRALERVIDFWKALGAKVIILSPSGHDRSVSLVSHLPHIVAFGLAGAVPSKQLVYAAEGYKDTTRVASSDPELWADIFLTNRKEIAKACREFERYYKAILKSISGNDYRGTVRLLKAAKSNRDKLVYAK